MNKSPGMGFWSAGLIVLRNGVVIALGQRHAAFDSVFGDLRHDIAGSRLAAVLHHALECFKPLPGFLGIRIFNHCDLPVVLCAIVDGCSAQARQ
jgi:hypothetical protein